MRIRFSPQVAEGDPPIIVKSGDTLTINGQGFDFSSIPDNGVIATGRIGSEHIVGSAVRRIDGEIHVEIALPIAADAPVSARFPEPVINPPDGTIPVPKTREQSNVDT